jgi:hypothetical protein
MRRFVLQGLAGSDAVAEEVDRLAKQTGHAIPLARKIFDAECAKLRVGATLDDYLVVLALRHTRDVLRARQANRRADEERSYDLFPA